MGTDIHVQVEVKLDGKWTWVAKFLPAFLDRDDLFNIPTDRNYNLFAILADVRNGSGFAGCDTGDGFNPIDIPRGLPNDMDPELLKAHEEKWVFGEHSFSWLTAKELKEYEWEQKTILRGVVNEKGFKQFKEKGAPSNYCGGVSGASVEIISNELMEDFINNPTLKTEGISYYTTVEWERSYINAVGFSVYWKYSNLYSLIDYDHKKKIKAEDVRIVFGFDS